MTTTRKRHTAAFKRKVALEAAKEIQTLTELSSKYGIHANQISQWKREFLEQSELIFTKPRKQTDQTKMVDELHRTIGQLTIERDWLKKKLSMLN